MPPGDFTPWLCLAPGNKISGGKVLSSRALRSSSRAAAPSRLAATTVGRRRHGARRILSSADLTCACKAKAVTATARKIAVLFYNTLRHGMIYRDPGADRYEEQYRSRVLANLKRRAKSLGFALQPVPFGDEVAVAVSCGCRGLLRRRSRREVRLHQRSTGGSGRRNGQAGRSVPRGVGSMPWLTRLRGQAGAAGAKKSRREGSCQLSGERLDL